MADDNKKIRIKLSRKTISSFRNSSRVGASCYWNKKMSKSNLGHESLKDEELLAQRSGEVISMMKHDRDYVIPFAKDMVDNVVTGALSILEISRKEGKSWKDVLAAKKSSSEVLSGSDIEDVGAEDSTDSLLEENQNSSAFSTSDGQRPVVQVMHLQVRDDVVCDSVHAEQVAKIVKGLQDIQIGDSAYVLPADGSNIEKQVKRAVRNINSLEFGNVETAQLIICDGQGDVEATILEAELGPPNNANSKPQEDGSKISTCFLHKMIEELEDSDPITRVNLPDHRDKKGIAKWEESEEQFIRIIAGPGDESSSASLEHREHHHPVIFDQALLPPGSDIDDENRNVEDSLSYIQQEFDKRELIANQKNCNRPRDLLDSYRDEDPYWCTAGLITRVVKTQQANEATTAEKQCGTSSLEKNLEVKRTETSGRESVAENSEEGLEIKDKESKVKSKKKNSLGKGLRKFFSRFRRSRDC